MADATFFEAPTDASLKKHRIVSKYYGGWANIVLPRALQREGKLMYVSLFCGPGEYNDGTRSTPLLVLDHTIATANLRENVQLVFNDENRGFIKKLEKHIADTPGVETLRYKPALRNRVVDRSIIPHLQKVEVPTMYFADPWGYQGVSINLIKAALTHWGSDFLLFFNYNRINMNLGCEGMNEPINEFFTAARAHQLRTEISNLRPAEREARILKEMQSAIKELGAGFGKFTYRGETGNRPTHHLVCASKHRQGMALLKEISAKESSRFDDDIPSLDHNPRANPAQNLLFSPLVQLEMELVEMYAGCVLTADEIYHDHHNGQLYVFKNYRQALKHLEETGAVSVDPPQGTRARSETIPADARITFRKAG
jgi:three-Cys-motif partner protein